MTNPLPNSAWERTPPRAVSAPTSRRRHRLPSPPFLRRRLAAFLLLMFTLGVAGPTLQFLIRGRVLIWAAVLATAIPSVGSGILAAGFALSMRREHRRALAAGGHICWNCGYALAGLPEAGLCPECGRDYAIEKLRERWRVPRAVD